jgi:hypothetical protein
MSERGIVDVIEKGNKRAEILYDTVPDNPREECENLGIMLCKHKRYNLGDWREKFDWDQFESWEEIEDYLRNKYKAEVILPLYLYDHSGITISTSPFQSRWDSGQVGFIYIDPETCTKWFGKSMSKEELENILMAEVEVYDMYLKGEVYQYRIFEKQRPSKECPHCHEMIDGEEEMVEVESCTGFYGIKDVREVVEEVLSE